MTDKRKPQKLNRRQFLRLGLGSAGVLVLSAAGALARADRLKELARRQGETQAAAPAVAPVVEGTDIRLAATDGYITLPNRADPLYIFGFTKADPAASINEAVQAHKGLVQVSSPILVFDEGDDVFITLTNLGLVVRPDLDDAHTIHWHGFRNPIAFFDGVPETSVSVPVARDFTYYFKPRDPGTYMYHCHFEDVEHVQMGMNGIVFVRPSQNQTGYPPTASNPGGPPGKYVYNDGNGDTAYDREFALMLNEIDTRPHDLLEQVQEFVWSDYKPNFWIMNGRSYPDTLLPTNDPSLPQQPISSLIQVNPGDRALLRFSNLGYESHAMQLVGIPMKVVGHDATYLGPIDGLPDRTYWGNTVNVAPGEARDVIFEAPAFDNLAATYTDGVGLHNRYYLKNRNYHKLNNGGASPGLGGMMTEVRVYAGSPLPQQSEPNETF